MKFTEHSAAESADSVRNAAIADLLDTCFDSVHGGRTYYKQVPHEHLLVWSGRDLIGHVGMDYRMVRVGEAILPILGIIDLCVAPSARRQGIGAALLQRAEYRAKAQSFSLAMADDWRLYHRTGYSLLPAASVTFLAIDELRSHSVIRRDLSDIFMVKQLAGDAWPDGQIDLLGYLF